MTQAETLKILKMGKNVFLTGAAGSGKTYVLNKYINFLKKYGVGVAVTASTGIAATHLKGMTIHSWSGIGIKDTLTEYDLDAMEQRAYLWKRFEKTSVLVIDEISMLSASTLNCVDQVCKLFKRSDLPFGGIQVIFSGDFFQLPPIEKKNDFQQPTIFLDEEESGTPFAFKAKSWKEANLQVCYLSGQFRQKDNIITNLLSEIRGGNFSDKSVAVLNKRIITKDDENITKLHTHNRNVDAFNNRKIKAIKSKEKEYKMTHKGNANLVEALKRGCLVPENLILKKGALVMFVKNNPTVGYVNGTVGKIVGFESTHPVVRCNDGNEYLAEPQVWSVEEGGKILAEISQVPLKLAWAVTIHKSQGMTLDKAVIDLSGSFVEGQGYVALSRVKTIEGLFLRGFNKMAVTVHGEILKIDKELKNNSNKLFIKMKNLKATDFKSKHKKFFKEVGAKKIKVLDDTGRKLSTYQITHNLIKKRDSINQIVTSRSLKIGTILTHIEKLLEDGSLNKSDIIYLKPKTPEFSDLIESVKEEIKNTEEFKLTTIFKALGGHYSFDEIRFAKIFC